MYIFIYIAYFVVCSSVFQGVHSQQCSEGVEEWVAVPEDQYDRNVTSLQDPDGRPLGYVRDTLYYVDQGLPNPCVHIGGTAGRRVEVMAESYPAGSTICGRDQENTIGCYDKLYSCLQAVADDLYFEFFCDGSSCEQTDVQFFYRLTVSPPDTEMDPELWCDNRDTAEYPSTLIGSGIPPGLTLEPIRTTKSNDASSIKAFTGVVTFISISSLLRLVL